MALQVGDTLVYTLTITNNGPAAATGITLTDTLPGGVTYTGSTEPNCTEAAGVVTCPVNDLAAGAPPVVVNLTVMTTATGELCNEAEVSGDQDLPVPAHNVVTECTTVTAPPISEANLSLTKSDSPDPVTAGELLVYTLTVTNEGPDTAAGISVTDNLPAGFEYHHAEPDNCTPSGEAVVTCTLDDLLPGESGEIQLFVIALGLGTKTNLAGAAGDVSDPVVAAEETTVELGCNNFAGLTPGPRPQLFFNGPVIYTLYDGLSEELRLTDIHPVGNPDGVAELAIGEGRIIRLPFPARWLRLQYIRANSAPLNLGGFDRDGNELFSWTSTAGEPERVIVAHVIQGPPMWELRIDGAQREAFLHEICYYPDLAPPPPPGSLVPAP
jgi:uncharacterized repeat protein (TIGR01451 family)